MFAKHYCVLSGFYMFHLPYFLLYIFYLAVFIYSIFRHGFFAIEGVSKRHLVFFFLLKVVAGLALTLVYTYYYTDHGKSDIYRYFNDSRIVSSVLFKNPHAWLKIITGIGTYDDDTFGYLANTLHFTHPAGDLVTNNSFLIRLISLLNYFSFYNIFIDTLFFNFITFAGLVALFKVLRMYFAGFPSILFLPLFLLPSVIFWTSGLLKESILFFGICIYLYAWLKGNESRTLTSTIILVLAFAVVALTKIYVAIILVFCSLFLPLSGVYRKLPYPLTRRIFLYLLIAFVAWYNLGDNFCEKIIYKRDDFILLGLSEKAGSAMDTSLIDPKNCAALAAIIPSSMVNAIVRPFIWNKGPVLQYIFAWENLGVLILMLLPLLIFFKWPERRKWYLILFCFSFAMLNYFIIGVTVPVMGAIIK
jgi:hypothetical protein